MITSELDISSPEEMTANTPTMSTGPAFVNPLDLLRMNTSNPSELTQMTAEDHDLLLETVDRLYEEERVEFSNAAENFLQRTRDVQQSLEFHGFMDRALEINQRLNEMCQHDHELKDAMDKEALADDKSKDTQNKDKQDDELEGHESTCAKKTSKGKCTCSKTKVAA